MYFGGQNALLVLLMHGTMAHTKKENNPDLPLLAHDLVVEGLGGRSSRARRVLKLICKAVT